MIFASFHRVEKHINCFNHTEQGTTISILDVIFHKWRRYIRKLTAEKTNVYVVIKHWKQKTAVEKGGWVPSGRLFTETLTNCLSLTWGWPEVLSMAPTVQILNRWVLSELFSLSYRTCISSENQ